MYFPCWILWTKKVKAFVLMYINFFPNLFLNYFSESNAIWSIQPVEAEIMPTNA